MPESAKAVELGLMDNITISVLLPNYNHRAFVTRALDALVAQSKQADEILVVDDCSTDDSVFLIEGYRDRLPQLRLIHNTEECRRQPFDQSPAGDC